MESRVRGKSRHKPGLESLHHVVALFLSPITNHQSLLFASSTPPFLSLISGYCLLITISDVGHDSYR
jgi:hypothetical protein